MRRPFRSASLAVAAVVVVLVLAGCGESDPGGATGFPEDATFEDLAGESAVTVDAFDNRFVPQYIEVSKGTAVTFVNEGRSVHNVLPVEDGAFEEIPADDFAAGDEATITFDEVGDFPYWCSLHGTRTRGMVGGIRVVE